MIVRSFDPFREFDRLAESFFGGRVDTMPFDAVRRDGEVVVEMDLPGVDPESIDVTVERNHVSVRAERTSPARDGDVVLASGRRHGEVRREFELGESLDASRLEANYDNGVLTLHIPLVETAQPRKVPVATARPAIDVESKVAGAPSEPSDSSEPVAEAA